MQKTANQIKSSFELLASGHYQIHSFLYAQEFEQQAYENLIYPLMLVYPLGGNLSGTTYTRNYRVIIADRVLKSEGNELEVESDTQLIALDVLAYWMKLGTNERFSITSSNTITPFWEKWGDEVTGHFVDIGIEEFYDFNSCAIPLSSAIPSPTNPCKDARILINSVIYGNAPSNSNFNVVVKDQLGALVGSLIGGEWIVNTGGGSCPNASYTIEDSLGNVLYTGTIPSGGTLTQAIGNSTLNVNNSVGTLISSESILAEGTDSYNVADSVAVIKDSLGTTLKTENILATASENITINDSVAVIKDSANNTLKSENILAEATENISISDSVAVIKDSANLTLKSENILAEATENIVINDSSVNVNKSDGTLISSVSVKAENTASYNVGDSLIENDASSPTYSQLVKATEGLILPTQEIQNNGVASGFIPSVGTINVTTNAVPTSFTITGRTIDIEVPSGGGSYDIDTTDRFGNVLPTIIVSANTTLNWNSYDYADLFLSRESLWGGSTIENALIDLVDDLVSAGLWTKIINLHPHIGTTANNHAWNLKYPFNKRTSFYELYSGTTHDSDGVYLSTGDTKTNFMNPLLCADVNSFTYGFFQTSNFDNNAATTNNTAMDNTLSSRGCQLAIRPSDGRVVWGINENAAFGLYTPVSQPTYIGRHTAMSRTAASGAGSQNLYIDGVSVATRTSASTQFGVGIMYGTEIWCKIGGAIQVSGMAVLLAKMGTEYSASGLNSTEMGDLHTALSTFEGIVR
jgi:hypothetical protein